MLKLAVTKVLHLHVALQALHEEEQDPDAGTVGRNVIADSIQAFLAVFKGCTRLTCKHYLCIIRLLKQQRLPVGHQLMTPAVLVLSLVCKVLRTAWLMFDLLQ